MAIEVGDVYRCNLFGNFLGQDILNVIFYQLETLGTELSLADELGDHIRDDLAGFLGNISSQSMFYTRVDTINMRDLADFNETNMSIQGVTAGDPMPSFVAYNFRLERTAFNQRYGYKRFAGVPESYATGNGTNLAPDNVNVLGIYNALLGHTTNNGSVFKGFVASRPLVLGENPSGRTFDEVLLRGLTTQNTRKAGAGWA